MSTKDLDALIEARVLDDSLYGSGLGLYSLVNEDMWEGPPLVPPVAAASKETEAARKLRTAQASAGIKPLQRNIPAEHVVPEKKENETEAERSQRIAKTVARENSVEAALKSSDFNRKEERLVRGTVKGYEGQQVFPPEEAEAKRQAAVSHLPGKHTTGEDVSPEEFQARAEQARIDKLQSNPDEKRDKYVGFQSSEQVAAAREKERRDTEAQGLNRLAAQQKLDLEARKEKLAAFKTEVGNRGLFGRIKGSLEAAKEAKNISKEEQQIGRVSSKGGFAEFSKAHDIRAKQGVDLLAQDIEWGKQKLGTASGKAEPEPAAASPKSANAPKPSAGTAPGPAADTPEKDLDVMSIANARGLFYRQSMLQTRIMAPIEGLRKIGKIAVNPWQRLGGAAASAPSGPPGHLR